MTVGCLKPEELLCQHNYGLVDRSALREEAWHKALPLIPIVPKMLRSDEEKMPALLPFDPNESYMALLADNLEQAAKAPSKHLFCCMLDVMPNVSQSHLLQHLKRHLVLTCMHGPIWNRYFLRYYDPRVMPHLVRIFRPAQIRSLLGVVTKWTIRFQREWIALPLPDEGPARSFWGVDTEQESRIKRILTLNRVLTNWKEQRGSPWANYEEYTDAIDYVEKAVDCAQKRYGIYDEDEISLFAFHALKHGCEFHFHSIIQTHLSRMQRGKYSRTVAGMGEQEWKQIGHNNAFK
jgi:hypothetical protein